VTGAAAREPGVASLVDVRWRQVGRALGRDAVFVGAADASAAPGVELDRSLEDLEIGAAVGSLDGSRV
jgi:hypothetical protein